MQPLFYCNAVFFRPTLLIKAQLFCFHYIEMFTLQGISFDGLERGGFLKFAKKQIYFAARFLKQAQFMYI